MGERRVVRSVSPVILAGFLSLVLAGAAHGQTSPGVLVRMEARGSVSQVASRLRKAAKQSGFEVMGRLDQGEALSTPADTVESLLLFVGDPELGRELFAADPAVGAAMPVRVDVYRGRAGRTHISYLKPSGELRPYGSLKIDKIAKMLDEKIHHMASAAAS